jgi:hypothetical protein
MFPNVVDYITAPMDIAIPEFENLDIYSAQSILGTTNGHADGPTSPGDGIGTIDEGSPIDSGNTAGSDSISGSDNVTGSGSDSGGEGSTTTTKVITITASVTQTSSGDSEYTENATTTYI